MTSAASSCRCVLLVATALPGLCLSLASAAFADPPPSVTIEAKRDREQLRREVNQFVDATIVKPHGDESLLRWKNPVCPLVAGMKREEGEFMLRRLSEVARAVNAPLAGQSCSANLFVIVAGNPGGFLELWWRRDRRLFNTEHGNAPVERFIQTPRPVRAWYNDYEVDPDSGSEIGGLLTQSMGVGSGIQLKRGNMLPPVGSRLTYTAVRAIASVIVVIDPQKVAQLNFGQLADYVSLISLAEINPDKDVGEVPSILKVFREPEGAAPQGLSIWDQALLQAVYTSTQKDRMQLSEIRTATMDAIRTATPH